MFEEGFGHEKLDAYTVALEYLEMAVEMAGGMPKSKGQLGDQLLRASESIVLRIAEGSGVEGGSADQRRHFRAARGSAQECAAILDVGRRRKMVSAERQARGRALLLRLVKMLSRLSRRR